MILTLAAVIKNF